MKILKKSLGRGFYGRVRVLEEGKEIGFELIVFLLDYWDFRKIGFDSG